MVFSILGIVLSLVSILIGIYMIVTGNPSLLHAYHYATTAIQNIPKLARWCGLGLLIMGLAGTFTVLYFTNSLPETFSAYINNALFIFFTIMLWIASITIIFMSIIHFNGTLFS